MFINVYLSPDSLCTRDQKPFVILELSPDSFLRRARIYLPIITSKSFDVGQTAETDLAQSVAYYRQATIGTVTETETVQVIGRQKQVHVGIASEADLSLPLQSLPTKIKIEIAIETDLVLAIGSKKTKSTGQASETQSAQIVAVQKHVTPGIASETEVAFAFGKRKTKVIGQSIETDWADRTILRLKVSSLSVKRPMIVDAELAEFSIESLRDLITQDVEEFSLESLRELSAQEEVASYEAN